MVSRQRVGIRRWLFASLLAFYLVLSGMASRADASGAVNLSGTVTGGSGKHPIYVALWDAQSFLHKPVQQIRIEPQAERKFHFNVSAGRWALSAFEDVNDNGVLDMGIFGPKEPSGFWHPFHAWRRPRFDDVAASIDYDTSDVEIKLSGK